MSDRPKTPLLDQIVTPEALRSMRIPQLVQVAQDLRAETISAVSETGGHLGAGLGVVELTVALHAIFDTPKDKIIWDVSHQTYPHKILTGRRDSIRTAGLPSVAKAPMTRLVPRILVRLFLPLWDFPSPAIWGGRVTPDLAMPSR